MKICGITNEDDALLAVAMGADALGFNFAPGSRRRVTVEAARDMAAKAREENAKLAARIEALEAKLAGTASGKSEAAKSTSAKPRAKT